MPQQNILIAVNNFLLIEGIQLFVRRTEGFLLKGTVLTKDELVDFIHAESVELVIMDYESMDFDNPKEISALKGFNSGFRLLLLANGLTHPAVSALTAVGIKNIVSKHADEEEFLVAIERTLMGRQYFSETFLDLLIDKVSRPILESCCLTSTEIEIVRLIAEGLTTKEIAIKKHISYHTVMTHRKNIFRKLKVTNVSELMLHAIKAGWIDNIEYYI
ncbi:MAG: response regulator transcription factor [Breznakibacter sp.]